METTISLFNRLALEQPSKNYKFIGKVDPRPLRSINVKTTLDHQKVVEHALRKYVYSYDYETIIHGYKRPSNDETAIYRDFLSGDVPNHDIIKDTNYMTALSIISEKFRPPHLMKPIHINDIRDHYPVKLKPSAEPPFTEKGKYADYVHERYLNEEIPNEKLNMHNLKPIVFEHVRRWHHHIKEGEYHHDKFLYYMNMHVKPALSKTEDENKMRTIFGVPKIHVYASIIFTWALAAFYKRNKSFTPLLWGYETMNGGWFRLNAELHHNYMHSSILMIDWKRFDKYAYFTVTDDIYAIIRSYLTFDYGYVPTISTPSYPFWQERNQPERLQRLFDWYVYAMKHMPVRLPDGSLWTRQFAGIPSGLYETQLLDSFYNGIMIITTLLDLGIPVSNDMFMKLMGDDSLSRLLVIIPPEQHAAFLVAMADSAKSRFNSIINVEKSKMSNSVNKCEVLSYTNVHGLPYRDPNQLLAQLYHTKSANPSHPKTMAMAIGIYYASCGFYQSIRDVCKDIFDFLASQGYSPDPAGFNIIFEDPNLSISEDIDLTRFPTQAEVQARLLTLDYVNTQNVERFYNSDFFIE